ncbi:MAG: sulfatase [Reyranella sp.]|nr:sulfatase [Reyranella sp.]
MSHSSDPTDNPSRRALVTSGAALLGSTLLAGAFAGGDALAQANPPPTVAPETPPAGYNILFVLVDEEHFFPKWPFPVPGREALKKKGVTFLNHQIASCVCSSARSVIYTGQHIQHSGVFDNLNQLWQPDMSTKVRTIGDRLTELGYHAAYQGKWHLSANLDQTNNEIDAPIKDYRKILETYGFQDFYGVGDLIDRTLGGFTYDDATASAAISWMRIEAQALRAKGQPWFLAVNFVNPHDVMYVDSDLPGDVVQGKGNTTPIKPPPRDEIYRASWDVPLPSTRAQPLKSPTRPLAQTIFQEVMDDMVGQWPNEDRRWKLLQDYYFNCIRDCDRQVERVMQSLKHSGMEDNTIVVFTADHGELGGHHQMRTKGTNAYRQQNHVPLMICHPAYPGGKECAAITSQLDLAPTIIGFTGKDAASRTKAAAGLRGRDFSGLLKSPETARPETLRPASLFNYNMLSYQDAVWAGKVLPFTSSAKIPVAQKVAYLEKNEPNFHNRIAIRSVWDGRYRFTRYFSPLQFNTPTTFEELLARNDLEMYDLTNDPDEIDNLAADRTKNAERMFALNKVMNERLAEEVGADDGSFLPIRNGKWFFPTASER